jgi:amidohydrolase
MPVAALRARVLETIDSHADALVELSRFIHANPEIALEEVASSAACAAFLEERGFAVERGVAGLPTAFRAEAASGDAGPTIAFLAEYDALPGIGHGCGHNLIAMAGIAAGLGLSAAAGSVPGRIRVYGTPAEEAVGGKIIMAGAGQFDDVDAALGAHPGASDAVCPSVEGSGNALACQAVRIAFHGKPAHAAADPFNGINALDAVIHLFNGVATLRQHVRSDARLHGIIRHGGDAPNVIPHFAEAEFYVRAATLAYMNQLVEKVRGIAEGAASITGSRLEFTFPEGANSDMITNYTIARHLKQHLDGVGLKMPEARPAEGNGSSDWGNVSYVVPSVETGYPIIDRICTWHSQDVVDAASSEMGFRNTLLVAKAMALTGLDLMTDPALLGAAKDEFRRAKVARSAAR